MATSMEMEWPLGSTKMYGTVVMPDGPGPFAAVVMAAGSGPTDRDWNSPLLPGKNGSARLLAEALADAGYASLRYDKRAAGPHAAENMQVLEGSLSMQTHREEYASAVEFMAGLSAIRPTALFGLGNSEGTLHVLHYQLARPAIPLAGIILAAPPGRSVGVVARWQLAAQAAAVPQGEALLDLYDQAVARFQAGESARPDPILPQGVKDLIAALESPANLPFSRELWSAESVSLLVRVTVPVLIAIGKKDIQVDWQLDGEPLAAAAQGMPNVSLVYPDTANHVLKYEPRDRSGLDAASVAAGYNAEGAILDPEALETVLQWLGRTIPAS